MRRGVFALVLLGGCASPEPDRIRRAVGDGAWRRLEELCDGIGHRLSGSEALDRAIAWAVETLRRDGHENVRAERVMVPKWVRGRESLAMVDPRRHEIAMLGLGGSVGTEPLTAEVVVVEHEDRIGDATGKIVLFNNRYTSYGESVKYRVHGARLAAAKGAVACLVRSVASASLRSPHTGGMRYGDAPRKIPAAAISTEDADLLARLAAKGRVVVTLAMEARSEGEVPSANVLAELRGRERPDEVVAIGGHLDSWDVGQGAHDDGAGCVAAMEALATLRRLGLRPRRTIRLVLWTNEENGLAGARAYAEAHGPGHVAAIEADSGGFRPLGFSVEHADRARAEKAIARLRSLLPGMRIVPGGAGADLGPLKRHGFPLLGLDVDMTRYFDVHHSHADTLDKVDPRELRDCAATLAVAAWLLAESERRIDE